MKLWKFHCMEDKWPGLWQRWFINQCVAVGWSSQGGYPLHGEITNPRERNGWSAARKTIQRIKTGDHVVVSLRDNRIGRIGQVTGLAIRDDEWNPLVPADRTTKWGEIGRRIEVRWDLTAGPQDRDMVTALPVGMRFSSGELRRTVCEIHSHKLSDLRKVMADESNWTGLWDHFDYEKALSGYIAAYPHRLADGLLPYPNEKIRERIFKDKKRLDVLLLDRDEIPVIVECKQDTPTVGDVEQLLHYLREFEKEKPKPSPRGILVHGGARTLTSAVRQKLKANPRVQAIRYRLELDFAASA